MAIQLADVMKYFNQGKMQWWGWKDTANGEVYSNLKLLDNTATMPTEDEINAKIAEIQVQENRKYDYPSIADQLDDIYHNGIDAWKETIKATKDKYPKPS
jgi:hypothetical protein|tara:strand:- start:16 stop:315 length:300 start_codon:yes stop_codon:yes gene_type:complete